MIDIIILSIDQSTKASGYAVFKNGKLMGCGVLLVDDKDATERLRKMQIKIRDTVKKYVPDYVVFENVQFQNNYATFQQLSQLQGIVMSILFQLNIGFEIIQPSAWKSFCGIKGKKREEQKKNTQLFVLDKYKLEVSEDEADSIGIGWWAVNNIIEQKEI